MLKIKQNSPFLSKGSKILNLITEEEKIENPKLDVNSTRTSKSRDATSLHPARKSNPFDLTYSPIVQSSTVSNTKNLAVSAEKRKETKQRESELNLTGGFVFRRIELGLR